MLELFARATCFVMPSLIEPFGIAYVEAASAGVSSIGSSVGGPRDVIGADGGIVVEPGDEAGLLRRCCDSPIRIRPGAWARPRASARGLYTWRKVAERLLRALGLQAPGGQPLAEFLRVSPQSPRPVLLLIVRPRPETEVASWRISSWAWGIPVVVLAILLGPLVLTSSTFGQDWPNNLWLVWQQSRNVTALGHPATSSSRI